MKPELEASFSFLAICLVRTAQLPEVENISSSPALPVFSRTSAMLESQLAQDLRHALICRCSGMSTLLWRRLTVIRAGRRPLSATGSREGVFVSVWTKPVRNDLIISGPVARNARCAGNVTCSACRKCRGERLILAMVSAISSARDRRNSRRARGGGLLPDWRAMPFRNALRENRAKVSSSTSRTIASKSSRVSFRRSGSVVISKRRIPVPGSLRVASTAPAWKPGVQRQSAIPGCRERSASSGMSSINRSAASASSLSRNSNR